MSILGPGKDQHRLFVVQVAYLRFIRLSNHVPQSLPGEVLLVVLDLPLTGMRFQYLLRGLQGKMPSPVGREDRELRHGVVWIPSQIGVRTEHGEPNKDIVVVDEVRATLRICEILLEVPVMQVPGFIHLVRVEHRHLIQVLLVNVPEQVAVVWMDRVQANHRRFLELTMAGLYVLDVSRRNPQPLPHLRRGVADRGCVDGAVEEEGGHVFLENLLASFWRMETISRS